MGNAMTEAKSEESSAVSLDVEESKNLTKDLSEPKEDPSASQGESAGDGGESKTLIEDLSETKEEEEGECGLCRYIKGGECREAFIELEKCLDECKDARIKFKTCMYENPIYYEPFLRAEAEVIAKELSELQAEKEAILAGEATAIAKALSKLQTEEVPILPAQAAAIAMEFRKLEAQEKEKVEESKGNE